MVYFYSTNKQSVDKLKQDHDKMEAEIKYVFQHAVLIN